MGSESRWATHGVRKGFVFVPHGLARLRGLHARIQPCTALGRQPYGQGIQAATHQVDLRNPPHIQLRDPHASAWRVLHKTIFFRNYSGLMNQQLTSDFPEKMPKN
jgi:hypothetical protein